MEWDLRSSLRQVQDSYSIFIYSALSIHWIWHPPALNCGVRVRQRPRHQRNACDLPAREAPVRPVVVESVFDTITGLWHRARPLTISKRTSAGGDGGGAAGYKR